MKRDEISLERLQALSDQFVDGTPEGYMPLHEIYPKHLYDNLRRKIAVELTGKEIAKIIDAEDSQKLAQLREAVDSFFDGRQGVYAPVHDFWSLVEMTLHVKKKELPELITAQNVTWTTEDLPLEQLNITWMPFLEQTRMCLAPSPGRLPTCSVYFSKNQTCTKRRSAFKKNWWASSSITLINQTSRLLFCGAATPWS
jgi:hypothetical protein